MLLPYAKLLISHINLHSIMSKLRTDLYKFANLLKRKNWNKNIA